MSLFCCVFFLFLGFLHLLFSPFQCTFQFTKTNNRTNRPHWLCLVSSLLIMPFQHILLNNSLHRLKPSLLKARVPMLLPSLSPSSWFHLSLKLLSMTTVTMVVPIHASSGSGSALSLTGPSSTHVRKLSLVWSRSLLSHLPSSSLSSHRCPSGTNSFVMWGSESVRLLLVAKVPSVLLVRPFMIHHHLNIHFMTFHCSSVIEIWSQRVQNFKKVSFILQIISVGFESGCSRHC